MMRTKLDNLDIRLLNAVQADNQASAITLSESVPLSQSAITRRLQRLRSEGVIAQDVAVLARDFADRRLTALIQVQLDRHNVAELAPFKAALTADPAVQVCLEVTGAYDMAILLTARDMASFNDLVDRLLGNAKIVRRYETSFVKKRVKTSLAVLLDETDS